VANGPVAHSTAPSTSLVPGSDLTIQDYAELGSALDRPHAGEFQARFRRVDSITGAEIVGRKGGNYSGGRDSLFSLAPRPQTTFASTACAVITLISNSIPPATSSRGRSTSARPAGLICCMSCPASTLGFSKTRTSPSWSPRVNSRRSHSGAWQTMVHQHGPGFLPLGLSGVYNWRGNHWKDRWTGRQSARREGRDFPTWTGSPGRIAKL